MIKSKVEKLINKQIYEEINSAYIYMSMANYLESKGWKGFAQWMKIQVQEELSHAKKFQDYLLERDGKVILETIPKPIQDWKSVTNVFAEAYKHEQHITECINNMVKQTRAENDYATEGLLQWFINEQVEEEANTSEIYEKLKAIKESQHALLFLDKELGSRVFIDSTQE